MSVKALSAEKEVFWGFFLEILQNNSELQKRDFVIEISNCLI